MLVYVCSHIYLFSFYWSDTSLILHVRLRYGSLSISTPVSLLANEFDDRSVLHGQVILAAVNIFL